MIPDIDFIQHVIDRANIQEDQKTSLTTALHTTGEIQQSQAPRSMRRIGKWKPISDAGFLTVSARISAQLLLNGRGPRKEFWR